MFWLTITFSTPAFATQATNLFPDSGTFFTTNPSFSWTAAAGATGYTLQLLRGIATETAQLGAVTTYTWDTAIDATGDSIFWRLYPIGSASPEWSNYASFILKDSTGILRLDTPIRGTTIDSLTPTFKWDTFTFATRFFFYLARHSDSVQVLPEATTIAGTSVTLAADTALSAGVTYQWRVKPNNADSWSVQETFVVSETKPRNLSPSGIVYSPSVSFTWDSIAAETQYYFQITGGALTATETFTTTVARKDSILSSHSDSYWFRVKSVNHSLATWTNWVSVKVTDTTGTVNLVSPAPGATIDTVIPRLIWDSFPILVRFYVSLRDTAGNIVLPDTISTSGTSYSVPDTLKLTPGVAYQWRVKPDNAETWTPVDTFIVGETKPVTTSPTGVRYLESVTFTWTAIVGETQYYFQITGGALPATDTFLISTNGKDSFLRAHGDSYWYRIKPATHPLGAWTSWIALKISDSSSVVRLISPVAGTTVLTAKPTLLWDTFVGAETFSIFLAKTTGAIVFYDTTTTSGTSYAINDTYKLTPGDSYQWRIKADNADTWSTLDTFIVSETHPTALTPNASVYSPSVSLRWDSTVSETQYYVQLTGGKLPGLETFLVSVAQKDSTLSTSTDSYWFRVKPATHALGAWSVWTSFLVRDSGTSLTLISPIDGARVDSTKPTLKWDTIAIESSYKVYLALATSGASILPETTTTSGTSYTISDTLRLTPGETYQWRIMPDITDTWTDFETFVVGETKPATLSPSGTLYSPNVSFTWNAIVGETQYYIQMTGGELPQTETFLVSTASKDSYLSSSSDTYAFRVKPATHSLAAWSNWSFFQVKDSSSLVILRNPIGGLGIDSARPTLKWDTFSIVTKFYVFLRNTANVVILPTSVSTSSTSYQVPETLALAPGDTYYWQVKADVSETWSAVDSFFVNETKPQNLSPTGTVYNSAVSFTWDTIAGETQYYFQISGGALPGNETFTVTVARKDSTLLTSTDTYSWRVRPATHPLAAWTSWVALRVSDSSGILDLDTPVNGLVIDTRQPILKWETFAFATSYNVYLVGATGNAILPTTTSTSGTSYYVPDTLALTPCETYYWNVKPNNGDTWSLTESFVVNCTKPATLTPTGTIYFTSLNFRWDTIVGETSYYFQITGGALATTETFTVTVAQKDSTLVTSAFAYWYRVKPASLLLGAWSNWKSVYVSDSSGTVTLRSPIDGTTVMTATPTLVWDTFPFTTTFYLRLMSATGQTILGETVSTSGTSYTVPGTAALTANVVYSWQVKSNVTETWTASETFLITDTRPQNLRPSDTTYNPNVTFRWDTMPGETQYYVQITGGSLPGIETFTVTVAQKDSALAVSATKYWFRVKPVTLALSTWSNWEDFVLDDSSGFLRLVSPIGGAAIDTIIPTLIWDTYSFATSFNVSLATKAGVTVLPEATVTSGTSLVIAYDTRLTPGETYLWRVKPNVSDSWSAFDSFVVRETSPRNLSPSSITYAPNVSFTWDTIVGETQYYFAIQGGVLTTMETFVVTVARKDSPITISKDSYFWRVKPITHPLGAWSSWVTMKRSDSNGLLRLDTPVGGTRVDTARPTLKWDTFTYAESFSIRVIDSAGAVIVAETNMTAGTSYSIRAESALVPATIYYWKVKPSNADSYSIQDSFIVNDTKPTTLTPNDTRYNPQTTFRWDTIVGETQYVFELMGGVLPSAETYTLTVAQKDSILKSSASPYFFRVLPHTHPLGVFSAWTTFWISDSSGIVRLFDPTNGERVDTLTPTFLWDTYTFATAFNIVIRDSRGTTILNDTPSTSGTSYALPGTAALIPGETYSWKIRPNVAASFSGETTFVIGDSGKVRLDTPIGGTRVDTIFPTLRWDTFQFASYYIIHLRDSNGNNFVGETSTRAGTSYVLLPDTPLTPGTTYFWRVAANVTDTWSVTDSFITADTKPTTLSPSGTTYNPTVRFTWDTIAGETQYILQIAGGKLAVSETVLVSVALRDSVLSDTTDSYMFRVKPHTHPLGVYSAWQMFRLRDSTGVLRLDTPVGGTRVDTVTPTLKWDSYTFTLRFSVQVTDSAGARIVAETNTTSGTSFAIPIDSRLTPTTIYYWLVKSDAAESWSLIDSFIVADTKPGNLLPANNDTVYSPSVGFRWDTIAAETQYLLQIMGGSMAAQESYVRSVASLESALALSTAPYYWRVKPHTHPLGIFTSWTRFWRADSTALLTLISPVSTSIDTNAPRFVWDTYAYATAFSIRIYDTKGAVIASETNTISGTSYVLPTDSALTPGTTYFWRVKPNVAETFSLTATFLFNDTKPTTLTPSGTIYQPSVVFRWDTIVGETQYLFQIKGGALASQETFTVTVAQKDSPLAVSSESYMYRITPHTHFQGVFSAWQSFQLSDSFGVLRLDTPIGGTRVDTRQPTLKWDTYTYATAFSIRVVDSAGVVKVAETNTVSGTSFTVTAESALTPAVIYYWQVRPNVAAVWSNTDSFIVADTKPTTLSPTGTIYNPNVSFRWDTIVGETQYTFQIMGGALSAAETWTVSVAQKDSLLTSSGTAYQYRVKPATHSLGVFSAWTAVTLSDSTGILRLDTPTRGTKIDTLTPTLRWDSYTFATSFYVGLSTITGVTVLPETTTASGTSYTVGSALTAGVTYQWRVRPNVAASFSATETFVVLDTQVVSLVSPKGGVIVETFTPTLVWDTFAGVTVFNVSLYDSSGIVIIPTTTTRSGTSLVLTSDSALSPGVTYFWTVKPDNSGSWAATDTFRVVDTKPTQFTVTGVVYSPNLSFRWDTIVGETQYRFTIKGGALAAQETFTVSVAQKDSMLAASSESYLYQVKPATHPLGVFSSWVSFKLSDSSGVLTLVSPKGGITVDSTQPRLVWDSYTFTTGFSVRLYDSFGLTIVAETNTTSGTSYQIKPESALVPSVIYSWRVKSNVAETWSATETFVLGETRTKNLTPSGKIYTTDVRLSWDTVAGETQYRINIMKGAGGSQETVTQGALFHDSVFPVSSESVFFRVKPANHPLGVYTQWTSFMVSESTGILTLRSPVNGFGVDTLTPRLVWDTFTYAKLFSVRLFDSRGVVIIAETNSTAGTSYQVRPESSLVIGETYQWKVKPDNALSYSTTAIFAVGDTRVLTLVTPIGGVSVDTVNPTLIWDTFPLVHYFIISVTDTPGSTVIPTSQTTTGTSFRIPAESSLVATKGYFWRVRPDVSDSWSATDSFVVSETRPQNLTPQGLVYLRSISFRWDTIAGETQYYFTILGGALTAQETFLVSVAQKDSTLKVHTDSYWWQVKPATHFLGKHSTLVSILLKDSTGILRLDTPIGSTRIDTKTPRLKWDSFTLAETFAVSLAETTGVVVFDSAIVSGTSLSLLPDTVLRAGYGYRWRVKPSNAETSSVMETFIVTETHPQNMTPADTVYSTSVSFRWDTIAGETQYTFQVTGGALAAMETWTLTVAGKDSTLAVSGNNYQWRVKPATHPFGTYSSWISFRVADSTGAVSLVRPIRGLASGTTTPTLVWDTFAGAQYFHVLVLDSTGATKVDSSNTRTGTSFVLTSDTALALGTIFSWRIKPSNSSSFSSTETFVVADTAIPGLDTPVGTTRVDTKSPTLYWDTYLLATSYLLSVSDSLGRPYLPTSLTTSGTSYRVPDTIPLDPGETYRWTVKPNASIYWAAIDTFAVNETKPTTLSPQGVNFSGSVTFRWDTIVGEAQYQLTIMGGALGVQCTRTLTVAQYDTSLAVSTESYFYRVRPLTHPVGDWSAWTGFKISDTNGFLRLISPIKGISIETHLPTLVWDTFTPTTSSFRVMFADSRSRTLSAGNLTVTGTSYTIQAESALPAGDSYIWSVKPNNSDSWAITDSFYVNETSPQHLFPGTNVYNPNVVFRWDTIAGETQYEIEIVKANSGPTPVFTVSVAQKDSPLFFSSDSWWFRVKPKTHPRGVYSSWVSFKVLDTTTKVTHISPPKGSRVDTVTPTLVWDTIPYAETFQVWFADSGQIAIFLASTSGTSYRVPDTLALTPTETYNWSIRPSNGTLWSNIDTFVVSGTYPATISPTHDSKPNQLTLTMSWNRIEPNDSFYFETWLSPTNTAIITLTANTFAVTASLKLGYDSVFWWRVKERGFETSIFSPWYKFTPTLSNSAPLLVYPPSGATNVAPDSFVQWTAVGETPYTFWLKKVGTSSPVFNGNNLADSANSETNFKLLGHVEPSSQYEWWVKAKSTVWSGPYYLTTTAFVPSGGGAYQQVTMSNNGGDSISAVTSNLSGKDTWYIDIAGSDLGDVLIVTSPDSSAKKFMLEQADTTQLSGNITQYLSTVIELKLKDASGNDISDNPSVGRTITIDYSGLPVTDPNKLGIFWYDPSSSKWYDVVTVTGMPVAWSDSSPGYKRDTVKKTVSIRVSHFSIFGLFPNNSDDQGGQSVGVSTVKSLDDVKVYPNPFKPNDGDPTTGREYVSGANGEGIYFHVNDAEGVEITIYSSAGELVRKISKTGNDNYIRWNVRNAKQEPVVSGVYVAVIEHAKMGRVVRKFVVIR